MRPRGPGNEDVKMQANSSPTSYPGPLRGSEALVREHSRTQSPSYARSTERDEGLWPNPYQTGI